jgi:disulfide bond formation protein DsbB
MFSAMTIVEIINKKLALATVLSQVFIVLVAFYLIWYKGIRHRIMFFLSKNGINLAFVVALLASGTSLWYSEFMGFEPCSLCWIQRIFMYPLVIILGLAVMKKEKNIVDYGIALALIGVLVAVVHNYVYYGGNLGILCDTLGSGTNCAKIYVFEFGYVTIPMMSLTGFVLIISLLTLQKFHEKKNSQLVHQL